MRAIPGFLLLLALKAVSRAFYRHDLGWVGETPPDPWADCRLAAILNHTSLMELLWAGSVPNRFLWQIAKRGVVPVADKTVNRPVVGGFFRLLGRNMVPISRKRDHTWDEVVRRAGPDSVVIILPEGRMMRADGLDKHGKPMTMRGGVADLIAAIPSGRMILAYSAGLHHVQTPGQGLPRLFRTIRMRFENLDVAAYRERLLQKAGPEGFKQAVVADLEARRDLHCFGRSPQPA